MKIIFNLMNCGLGNNGGSLTIVKSANILKELGHEVFVVDTMSNQLKWIPLNASHIIVKNENDIPNADAVIATGFGTVDSTLKLPDRCGQKYHWIRAWETWKMNEKDIVKKIVNVPTIKLVNSICLQNQLLKYKCKSYIVRPGYDFDLIFPLNIRKNNVGVVLGGLYNTKDRKRFDWISRVVYELKMEKPSLKLYLFGDSKYKNLAIVDKYYKSPNDKEKNKFFNEVDIWLAPTKSEGLHIPPAEAMLTECPVVGTEAELSGTQDYLINNATGLVSKDDISSFKKCVKTLIENKQLRNVLGKNARNQILELGDRKKNMNEFVNLMDAIKTIPK